MIDLTNPVHAKGIVHWRIASAAKGVARAYWESSASRSNIFYANTPDPELFVAANWQAFVPIARGLLTDLLGLKYHPGTITPITEAEKAEIYEALKLDGAVNPRKARKNSLLATTTSPATGYPPNVH